MYLNGELKASSSDAFLAKVYSNNYNNMMLGNYHLLAFHNLSVDFQTSAILKNVECYMPYTLIILDFHHFLR